MSELFRHSHKCRARLGFGRINTFGSNGLEYVEVVLQLGLGTARSNHDLRAVLECEDHDVALRERGFRRFDALRPNRLALEVPNRRHPFSADSFGPRRAEPLYRGPHGRLRLVAFETDGDLAIEKDSMPPPEVIATLQ